MSGDESKEEQLDRELIELLNELRVALPGVQVLFAFLLGVPFTQRFGEVTDIQKDAYFLTFLCTAIATALLIAPSAYHRLNWRRATRSTCSSSRTGSRSLAPRSSPSRSRARCSSSPTSSSTQRAQPSSQP